MIVTVSAWGVRCDLCLKVNSLSEPTEDEAEKRFVEAGGLLLPQPAGHPKHLCQSCAGSIQQVEQTER